MSVKHVMRPSQHGLTTRPSDRFTFDAGVPVGQPINGDTLRNALERIGRPDLMQEVDPSALYIVDDAENFWKDR